MNKLDRPDLATVAALQQGGRMTITALSVQVGLSSTPCQIRLKRFQKQGLSLAKWP
tara:strand:- start:243 stop:410 length:168 start_codon:yes stop_codon:yes gene_type:complete